nr:uncharacterized protein LOC119175541 [Rhipicephalus microplus]
MQVQLGPVTVSSSLIVVDHRGPLLCGRDTIEEFRKAGMLLVEGTSSSVNVVHADSQLTALLDGFPDLFENLGCCKEPPVKLYLKESAQPRFLKARTVPYAMRAQVSAEIDRLVEVGVLSPVSVAEWATPVVPVAKKNGDIRLCGDFKLTVNPATRTEQYPLPKIDDIFAALSGGEVFSTLDLRNAYNQLPLDDDAKKITVLNTHKGLFCYNRLAFGIASAPALFQRRIEAVLQGIPGVKVYLDDIIVAEKEYDTTILRQVFERLRANGLTLNKEKCHFREKEVVFLGHRIDAKGLHPLQDNLEAVLAAPPPTSRTAFQETKRAMRRANFLVHYDPQRPLRLECDASAEGPDKPIPQMAAARIQRWVLLLAAYQYDLEYRKGELNANADALSRLPLPVRDNGWENELAEYVLHAQAMDDFALSAQSISDHTSKDDVLQQVKTWILQGWPRRLGSEEQQYQPYFARRTTPTREEQSPAERLFGFQPRTRLSTYLAEEDGAKREATVNGVPNSGKKEFAPGREVWSRQYSQLGQRWLPGTVTTVEGKRLLTVNTPRGVQRRHVDQVRPRDSSTPVKKEPCETPIAMEQLPLSSSGIQSTSSEALQAGLSEPGEEASGGGIEPASPRSTAEPLPLRRSTRARKPPDRF